MNRKRTLITLMATLLFLLWTVCAAYAGVLEDIKSKGELVVSTDANYAPQSFLNDKGKLDGFDIDVSKEVAKRMGVKVKGDEVFMEPTVHCETCRDTRK